MMLLGQAKQKLIPFPEMSLKFNPHPCALAVEVTLQKASTSIKAYQTFSKKSTTTVFCLPSPSFSAEPPGGNTVDTPEGRGRGSQRSEKWGWLREALDKPLGKASSANPFGLRQWFPREKGNA